MIFVLGNIFWSCLRFRPIFSGSCLWGL